MVNWKMAVLIGALAGAAFTLLPFSSTGQIATIGQQAYTSDAELQAKRSPVDFVADGDATKPSWRQAKSVEFDNDASGNPQPERVNHYYEFEIAPNNQWIDLEIDKTKEPFNDASWNSGFEHATRIDAQNHIWTAEMRIPISSMNISAIHPGAQWRANFFRAAGKGGDDHRKFLAWSIIPEGKTFHVPTRFGILRLVN
ncbi:MAG: hypothetical protein DMG53_24060 [Acidobacteria bacterium]|nr:MAG: hypothetical protein DMG53_24060 [Acidobacteriota bacterium]